MTKAVKSALIIGGGHNGLACAAYLARAGVQVTVLEAAERFGGAAVTREFAPGFQISAGAHLLFALDEKIRSELQLDQHGLEMAATALETIGLDEDGDYVSIAAGTLSGPGALEEDKTAMTRYQRQMNRFADIIWGLKDQLPPRMGTTAKDDLLSLGKLGLKIRRLGTEDMREFLRITGINVYDILQERFTSEHLKGALSVDGTLGTFLGTRSNNSVFCALHRFNRGRDYALPKGGMGAVSDALAAAAKAAGATLRTNARVASITMDFDRASGVTLSNGETLEADVVISNADPKTTFFELLGARHLEAGFANRVHHLRTRGCVAKLHLALDGLPGFTGLDETQLGKRLLIAADMQYVEHAFNHAKYGEYAQEPVLEITIPSVHDASLAPAGQHVLSANVAWAPYDLKGGWTEAARADFLERCLSALERYAPGLRGQILHSELLTPVDMEQEFGMTGGHWHHVELALDAFLMMRPTPGAAQYATPVSGLYLCGAGSHPGGNVTGCVGRNAAKAVLNGQG
ncbi:MAG: NAD(P)/FAD-dependent oxidoreductase [Xanthomonadales bacterium]|nr:NAD(P)/FAD-dependent oxidoreductase [Xanthomonadales bacterium]